MLQLKEVEKPVPGEGRVLVRIRAASVNPADYHTMRAPFLFRLIIAYDIAGGGRLKIKGKIDESLEIVPRQDVEKWESFLVRHCPVKFL